MDVPSNISPLATITSGLYSLIASNKARYAVVSVSG